MTRINVGIKVSLLTDQHLLAEHREIIRIPNTIVSNKAVVNNIPPTFRLGAGHVKFFYTRLEYLRKRYIRLYLECQRRGFDVQNYINSWDGVRPDLMGDYVPTNSDRMLILMRLQEKLNNAKIVYRYHGEPITNNFYNNQL